MRVLLLGVPDLLHELELLKFDDMMITFVVKHKPSDWQLATNFVIFVALSNCHAINDQTVYWVALMPYPSKSTDTH